MNFRYWHSSSTTATPANNNASLSLTISSIKTSQPNTEKLREFAAKQKAGEAPTMNFRHDEEYWTPTLVLPPSPTSSNTVKSLNPSLNKVQENEQERVVAIPERRRSPVNLIVPTIMAALAEVKVGFEQGEIAKNAGLKEHVGGNLALEVVNSFELQILLAGITWFVIGMAIMGLTEVLRNKEEFRR